MFTAKDVKTLRDQTGAGMLDCKKALEENNGDMEKAIDWLREKGIAKAAKKETRIAAEGLCQIVTNEHKALILEVNSETDFVAKNQEFRSFVDDLANTLLNSEVSTMEEALQLPMDGVTVKDKIVAVTAKIGEKISFRRFTTYTKTTDEIFGTYIHMGGKMGVIVKLTGSNEEVAKDIAMHACAMRPAFLNKESVDSETLAREEKIAKEQAINEGKPQEIAEKMVAGRINKFYKEVCLCDQEFIKDPDVDVKTYAKNNGMTIIDYVRYEVGEGLEKRNDDFAAEVMNQVAGDK